MFQIFLSEVDAYAVAYPILSTRACQISEFKLTEHQLDHYNVNSIKWTKLKYIIQSHEIESILQGSLVQTKL